MIKHLHETNIKNSDFSQLSSMYMFIRSFFEWLEKLKELTGTAGNIFPISEVIYGHSEMQCKLAQQAKEDKLVLTSLIPRRKLILAR